jgi:hypothetical protein
LTTGNKLTFLGRKELRVDGRRHVYLQHVLSTARVTPGSDCCVGNLAVDEDGSVLIFKDERFLGFAGHPDYN